MWSSRQAIEWSTTSTTCPFLKALTIEIQFHAAYKSKYDVDCGCGGEELRREGQPAGPALGYGEFDAHIRSFASRSCHLRSHSLYVTSFSLTDILGWFASVEM